MYFPSEETKQRFFETWTRYWQDNKPELQTPQSSLEDSPSSIITLPHRKRGTTSTSSMTATGPSHGAGAHSSSSSLLESDAVGIYIPTKRSRGNDFTLYSTISTRNKRGRSQYKWVHNITSSEYVKIQIFRSHAIAGQDKKDWWKSCVNEIQMPCSVDLPMNKMDHALRQIIVASSETLAAAKEKPVEETELEVREDRTLFPDT